MRRLGFSAPGFLIVTILLLVGTITAPVAAFQDATPPAGTPAVTSPIQTDAQAAATPAAAPTAAPVAQAAVTDVVTLVLWYTNPIDAEIIELFPIAIDGGFVAGPAAGAAPSGTVSFPEDGVAPPTVVIADTTFEAYPRADGVIQRWTWLDDFEGARPGTLVMQIAGQGGLYQDFYGTATMISRDEGGAGGVLIVALRPPSLDAEAPADAAAAAEDVPAEDVPAEPAPEGEAVVEVAPEDLAPVDETALEPAA